MNTVEESDLLSCDNPTEDYTGDTEVVAPSSASPTADEDQNIHAEIPSDTSNQPNATEDYMDVSIVNYLHGSVHLDNGHWM